MNEKYDARPLVRVSSVSFSTLTLLFGWLEGYPASKETCVTYHKRFFHKNEEKQMSGNRLSHVQPENDRENTSR